MDISSLKKAARYYGPLRLSKRTGLARSYLYKFIEGSSSPTLEALEKIADALGFEIEIRRKPIEDSVEDVSTRVKNDGNWKLHYFNFVDAFRRTRNFELVKAPPIKGLGERECALLSSIVLALSLELGVKIPKWTLEAKPLEEPWFVAGMENLKAIAIVESPLAFKRNNIFVLENFLSRA